MTVDVRHATREQLEAGLEIIRAAPKDHGILKLIVRRPQAGAREVLDAGVLDPVEGLIGDNWRTRGSSRTADGSSHPDMQLNVMSARAIALIADEESRWPLAGDQLFVDLDLSAVNSAVIEVTNQPHTGCDKFVSRFGLAAMKFVNSPTGRELNLRGINARVVTPGRIGAGDRVTVARPGTAAS
jgi:hypothetical protein